jgi:uncharacterized membrane protein
MATKKNPLLLLWLAITLYILFFSILVLWKYSHFYYDNLDLAIFNNVFWNTLHGHIFEASIHPASYLGDHFSPSLFLLIPFYAVAPRPETLLILQTIAIALSAIPVYLIAKHILGKDKSWVALFISFLWLINPLVHNMNFFEFELMGFTVLGLLWVIWAYVENRKILFIVASLLTLGMREDFIFILCMFSILALIEKRSRFWKLYPLLMSMIWGIVAFKTISLFAPHNAYKFLRYYAWLGGTDLPSIAISFIMHPWQILLHLATWYNLEFVLGILFPLFFFVSFRNRWALLLIPPAAQIMLAQFGGSALLLSTYYAGYLVAILFVLCMVRIRDYNPNKISKFLPIELTSKKVVYSIILFASLYSALSYGSIATAVTWWQKPHLLSAKNRLLSEIPKDAAVATTYELLTPLSSRRSIYLFQYAAIGKNQFALGNYTLPQNTEYLLIDWNDMALAQMHFSSNTAFANYADTVPENLKTIFSHFNLIDAEGSILLLKRSEDAPTVGQLLTMPSPEDAAQEILTVQPKGSYLEASIRVPHDEGMNYFLQLEYQGETTRIPVGYGLAHSSELRGKGITMPVFIDPAQTDTTIKLFSWSKGFLELTGIKSLSARSDSKEVASYHYNATR